MTYSEQNDFEEKNAVLSAMHERLNYYKIVHDFSSANTLEIGGAGGVFGGLISSHVRRVIVSDIIDSQLMYNGEFPRLLKEKFIRNGFDFSFDKIEFHVADAINLPYKDNLFDLVVSVNAFEHIPEPILALQETVRVVKKGGVIYLTFDPIWTADSGNHFTNFVPEPWRHLLCDTNSFCNEMQKAGASGDQLNDFRYGMNRKPAKVYSEGFPRILESLGVEKYHLDSWSGCIHEEHTGHPNRFAAGRALGCSPDELLIRGFAVCIVK